MRVSLRRLTPVLLSLSLVAAIAPVAAATEGSTPSPSTDPTPTPTTAPTPTPTPIPTPTPTLTATQIAVAEGATLSLTNQRRADLGLVALRWDSRIAAIARARAEYMAATDRMSHVQADGRSVFDIISTSRITWYGAGEILAWNNAQSLDYSVGMAVQGWMNSPTHRSILTSAGYNYVGFGMAISPTTGIRYWAGVYLKGPDRTKGWAKVTTVSKTRIDARRVRVTIKWKGGDTKLQVLTSGLRYYQMQARRVGGTWRTYDTTTRTYLKRTWTRGKVYEFRVRSRDRAGHWSPWSVIRIRT